MENSIPPSAGIYKIICIPTKKIYIGSAVNLHRRENAHWYLLGLNKHTNPHLQNAWNKYGEQAFVFEVVELVLPLDPTNREQYWLNKLKPFGRKGFNIARDATAPTRGRPVNLGRKHTPEEIENMKSRKASLETRARKRQSALARGYSPEAVESMRQANLGRKKPKQSPEHIEKLRQTRLNRKHTPETKEKQRQSHLGRPKSPEHIEKLSKPKSPEARENMRLAWVKRRLKTE